MKSNLEMQIINFGVYSKILKFAISIIFFKIAKIWTDIFEFLP